MGIFYITCAVLLFILLSLSFLFSLSETSIISISKLRLRHLLAKGARRAKTLERIVVNLDKLIAAILIGNNLVNITISVIATTIFVMHFGYKWGSILSTLVSAFFILIFCEITPKILATKHTEKVALFSAPLMEYFVKFFQPASRFFIGISNFLLRLFGVGAVKRTPLITEEELRLMIELGREEGILSDEERRLFHRIFEFGSIKVADVMVPKPSIVAIDIKAAPDELLNTFVEQGHARLPVYEGSIDNITGIIYARDLLYILKDKGLFLLQDLLRQACYVNPDCQVNELLRRFQAEKIQIAIVVDKTNKTLGLVTLEDLLEEIVGEIEEEHSPKK